MPPRRRVFNLLLGAFIAASGAVSARASVVSAGVRSVPVSFGAGAVGGAVSGAAISQPGFSFPRGNGGISLGSPPPGLSSRLPGAAGPEAAAPAPARLFQRVLSESPETASRLEDMLEGASFRPLLGDIADPKEFLSEKLGSYFEDYLKGYAQSAGFPDLASALAFLESDEPEAAAARTAIARLLKEQGSARSENWTFIFRDAGMWEERMRAYLAERIALKRAAGTRELDLQSVGAAFGAEPYTLAIVVDESLKAAGEDPAAWRVRIKAVDLSLMSLISMDAGVYRSPEGGPYFIPEETTKRLNLEVEKGNFSRTADAKTFAVRPGLRDWIRPTYLNLDDVRQHAALTDERPDVVFANYILTHLRHAPAEALAEHWLSGEWSEHGFLSMAAAVVAEVFSGAKAAATGGVLGYEGSFLRRFGLTVGAIGGSFAGDSRSVSTRLRDLLFTHRTRAAREVFKLRDAFIGGLRADPFHAAELDLEMLAHVSALIKKTGLRPELTTDEVLTGRPDRGADFFLNAGFLIKGPADNARRAALLYRMWPPAAPEGNFRPRGPPRKRSDPRWGEGSIVLEGAEMSGARLKAVDFPSGPRLYWLSPGKLVPITDRYVEEKKPPPPIQGRGIRVTF